MPEWGCRPKPGNDARSMSNRSRNTNGFSTRPRSPGLISRVIGPWRCPCVRVTILRGRGRLAVELVVGVVERVLQHRGHAVIVLGGDEDEAVELGELARPAARDLVPWWRGQQRAGLVEERQRVVAQIDDLDGEVAARG